MVLALGIGANTAIFSAVRGVLLRPLPHKDGYRLMCLRQSALAPGSDNIAFSAPEINDFRQRSNLRIGGKSAEVVGVPAPFFPQKIDAIMNMSISEHQVSATMVQGRTHRVTEMIARLAPGATVNQARAEVNGTIPAVTKWRSDDRRVGSATR